MTLIFLLRPWKFTSVNNLEMGTSSEIETAWASAIWAHATIQALTNKILPYQITTESEFEIEKLMYANQMNFFEVLTGRGQKFLESGDTIGATVSYFYVVEINYYRQINDDTVGANFIAIRNAFETIFELIVSELGYTWTNTVDIWRPEETIPTIVEVLINNKKCWKGTARYFAEKNTNL